MSREVEAKFYVRGLNGLQQRLSGLDARLIQARTHEVNLRFDTDDNELRRTGRVLRLRQDTASRITYKDAGQVENGALNRREVEFTVSDFDAAREFLEALGFKLVFVYEKQRTTYKWEGLEVMLDELPYGDFVEIEGSDCPLQSAAEKLGLRWERAIPASYSQLFEILRTRRNLAFRDLTFENFDAIQVSPDDLGVQPADV
jgi:adenylate cyclase, class 2